MMLLYPSLSLRSPEIVSRVCAHESPPFRPIVRPAEGEGAAGASGGSAAELLELAARCWAQMPDERPTFDTINANYIK